jgi:hypothetical protein
MTAWLAEADGIPHLFDLTEYETAAQEIAHMLQERQIVLAVVRLIIIFNRHMFVMYGVGQLKG